jgi:hypothetical protein
MAIITTYVCDCCGGQSTSVGLFAPAPTQLKLGPWALTISNGPFLCNVCLKSLNVAATDAIAPLFNSKVGVTLT